MNPQAVPNMITATEEIVVAALVTAIILPAVIAPVLAEPTLEVRTLAQCDGPAALSSWGHALSQDGQASESVAVQHTVLTGGGPFTAGLSDRLYGGRHPESDHAVSVTTGAGAAPVQVTDSVAFSRTGTGPGTGPGTGDDGAPVLPCNTGGNETSTTSLGVSSGGVLTGGIYTAGGHAGGTGLSYDTTANGTGTFRMDGYLSTMSGRAPVVSGRLGYRDLSVMTGRFTVSRSFKAELSGGGGA